MIIETWCCPRCGELNEVHAEFSADGWCQGRKCIDIRGEANRFARSVGLRQHPALMPEMLWAFEKEAAIA